MTPTSRLIKECFDKAGMKYEKDDRAKYLFQLLCDKFDTHFNKLKKSAVENEIANILAEGYNLDIGHAIIESAANADSYVGNDSEFVVRSYYESKGRGYKTLDGAMRRAEELA